MLGYKNPVNHGSIISCHSEDFPPQQSQSTKKNTHSCVPLPQSRLECDELPHHHHLLLLHCGSDSGPQLCHTCESLGKQCSFFSQTHFLQLIGNDLEHFKIKVLSFTRILNTHSNLIKANLIRNFGNLYFKSRLILKSQILPELLGELFLKSSPAIEALRRIDIIGLSL